MPQSIQISESEWEVMQVAWDRGRITAAEVIDALGPRTNWNHRTIRTLLNRLINKGALNYVEDGNRYLYSPAVTRTACVREEGESFLHRVFGGDPASLLVHFAKRSKLSEAEIAELQRILDEKRKGGV
jgi:BlaI family penicillinase repressor